MKTKNIVRKYGNDGAGHGTLNMNDNQINFLIS